MQERVLLKEKLLEEINSNDIKIDNVEFKNKVNTFNECKNLTNTNEFDLIKNYEELLNEYVELLKNNYIKNIEF